METPTPSLAEKAKRLRKHSQHETVSPERRKEMLRVANNLEALARYKAKKAQEQAAEYPTVSRTGDSVPSRDQLHEIFCESSQLDFAHLREQLNHTHMVALADMFDGWALGEQREPEQSAKLMGWADGLRHLADEVGPSWSPPEPERLSPFGFLARRLVREP